MSKLSARLANAQPAPALRFFGHRIMASVLCSRSMRRVRILDRRKDDRKIVRFTLNRNSPV